MKWNAEHREHREHVASDERVAEAAARPHASPISPVQGAAIDAAMRKLSEFSGATAKADALKTQVAEVAAMAEALGDVSMAQMASKLAAYVAATKKLEAMCRELQ